MVRKQTWFLLAVFAALLAAVFYLQKNPLPAGGSVTPSPTAAALLFEGWQPADINAIEYKDNTGSLLQLVQDGEGNWSLAQDGQKIEAGAVEQIRSEITSLRPLSTLPADFNLEPVGLAAPIYTFTIKSAQGKQAEMKVGVQTPTETGYYIQVDNRAPVVVNKAAVEGLLDQLTVENLAPTPTAAPDTGANPQPTATP